MKVRAKKTFKYEGEEITEGEVVDLPDGVARSVIKKGYGEEHNGEVEGLGESPDFSGDNSGSSSGNNGPIWQDRVVIKQNKRNISVELWPPSEKHPEWGPQLRLKESRKSDDGNWNEKRIELTRGPKTLMVSEMIREGWKKQRERTGGSS